MSNVMGPKIYPLVSPTVIQKIESIYAKQGIHYTTPNYDDIEGSMKFVFNLEPFNSSKDQMPAQSPIQIWNASNPFAPQLLGSQEKDLTGAALTNFKNLRSSDVFYRTVFKCSPINTDDQLIRSFNQHPQALNNAFYHSPTQSVYYGHTNPEIFTPLINNPEITTHELGHAITDFSSGLIYQSQSGALNESLADVFAIMHKHYSAKVKAGDSEANWLIGEGVVVYSSGKNQSIRSMSHPGNAYLYHPLIGSDLQVFQMSEYLITNEDNGGVHTNSGIPNHAFYLAAKAEAGYSWEKIGKIWYDALRFSKNDTNFSSFANLTIKLATRRYSQDIAQIVAKAWTDVGVDLRENAAIAPIQVQHLPAQLPGNWQHVLGGFALGLGGGLFLSTLI